MKKFSYLSNDVVITSDEISEAMSRLMVQKLSVSYLMFSFSARAKSSGYSGFSAFFDDISKDGLMFACEIRDLLGMCGKKATFGAIGEIKDSGNKLIDLIGFTLKALDNTIEVYKDLKIKLNMDMSSRIAFETVLNEYMAGEIRIRSDIHLVLKQLEKCNNDYSSILMIDQTLGEKYGKN